MYSVPQIVLGNGDPGTTWQFFTQERRGYGKKEMDGEGKGEGELRRGRENELELLPCKLFTTVPSRWEEGVLEGERV